MIDFLSKKIEWVDINYWFGFISDMNLLYILAPLMVLEIVRYAYLRKLSKNLVLDGLANIVVYGAFLIVEIILGFLALSYILFWVHQNFSLTHLELNWATVIACILLADFAYYWEHRTLHRIGIGWATHTVHHSSPHFNFTVAYRFGPLDSIPGIIFLIPVVMLGFDPLLAFFSALFVLAFQTFLHTEMVGKLIKPVEYIFNTPSHHRVHHGSNPQYWDKNYGGILIIWDRMLGTFAKEEEKVVYGISEPLESVNPIKVFFHGLTRFFKKLRKIKGGKNKVLAFIKSPDWMPEGQ